MSHLVRAIASTRGVTLRCRCGWQTKTNTLDAAKRQEALHMIGKK